MRILVLHNATLFPGGGEIAVANEVRMLRDAGFDVRLFIKENSKLTLYNKQKLFVSPAFSKDSFEEVSSTISDFNPSVVHIHNFTPQWTWAAFKASLNYRIPTVHTMHAYGLICPANMLLKSNGSICHTCLDSSKYKALLKRCKTSSTEMKIMNIRSLTSEIFRSIIDNDLFTVITLTPFGRKLLMEDGFLEKNVIVKPHFTYQNTFPSTPHLSKTVLYVGRLSPEKGVDQIIREFNKIRNLGLELRIIGEGPSKPKLISYAKSLDLANQVQFLGYQPQDVCKKEYAAAMCVVMNSRCYEGFGLVLIEAFSAGIPVIATDLGAMHFIIEDGYNGFLIDAVVLNFASKIEMLVKESELCEQMSKNARKSYERWYTPEKNIIRLLGCYKYAIQKCGNPVPSELAGIQAASPHDNYLN